jgi:hypothetical protein
VFLPSIPVLLGYAAELEAERDHVLAALADDAEDQALAAAQRGRSTQDLDDELPFQALEASAQFDRVLYDGGEFGVSAEEEDFLGLPGLLDPEQVRLLLKQRQAGRRAGPVASQGAVPPPAGDGRPAPVATREGLAALRKELNGLIAAWHHRTGQPHGAIHAELRRACGGPPLAAATGDQIRARIQAIRGWTASRR